MSRASDDDDGSPEPNKKQRKLINNTDGTYLVDAGAGTGKTFAVTRRYAHILDTTDSSPDDILVVSQSGLEFTSGTLN
jgi:superfamily I DNA/RNA helicase